MYAFSSRARAQRLAGAQAGRITWAQLLLAGLSTEQIRWWVRTGILTRTRSKVYALGYIRTDLRARIWEAVLYAGPDAALTGASGAHHLELIDYPPPAIKVTTPWQRTSVPGIIVLARRPIARTLHDGIPVASVSELVLELAAEGDYNLVRKALSNLEFRRELDVGALLAVCRSGRRGARLLRRALTHRLPRLAHCRSPLEVAFLLLLEAHHLPLPCFNVRLHGILVDGLWPDRDPLELVGCPYPCPGDTCEARGAGGPALGPSRRAGRGLRPTPRRNSSPQHGCRDDLDQLEDARAGAAEQLKAFALGRHSGAAAVAGVGQRRAVSVPVNVALPGPWIGDPQRDRTGSVVKAFVLEDAVDDVPALERLSAEQLTGHHQLLRTGRPRALGSALAAARRGVSPTTRSHRGRRLPGGREGRRFLRGSGDQGAAVLACCRALGTDERRAGQGLLRRRPGRPDRPQALAGELGAFDSVGR